MFLSLFLLFLSTYADEGYHHDHKAHVHGKGEAKVVLAVSTLRVRLNIPGESSYGFEHEAKNAADKAAIEVAKKEIQTRPLKMDGGDCELKESKVDVEQGGGHSELQASFEYNCKKPLDIKSIEFWFLKRFKNLDKLEVAFVSKSKQKKETLDNKNNILNLQ